MIKLTRWGGTDVWIEPSALMMVEGSDTLGRPTDAKAKITLTSGVTVLVMEDVQHVLSERLKATQLIVDADGIEESTLTVMPGRFVTSGRSGFVK